MLKTKRVGKDLVVYLRGRLDVHLSGEIEKELNTLIQKESDANLVVNLEDIEYMSSSGLRVLVAVMRQLKSSERSLRLCNLNAAVRKIFEVVELMDMFEVFDNEDAALSG